MTDDILQRAIDNNISWCSTIAAAHGHPGSTQNSAWVCHSRMPPFYPNLITRNPRCDVAALLQDMPAQVLSGLGVKDSFASLDLQSQKYALALEADWYHRPPAPLRDSCLAPECTEVSTAAEFQQWELAWRADAQLSQRIFKAELLKDNTIHFLYTREIDSNAASAEGLKITAGAVLNETADVVGVSNLFGSASGKAACLRYALDRFADRHFVGYGSSEELALVGSVGFRTLAPLRVWIHP